MKVLQQHIEETEARLLNTSLGFFEDTRYAVFFNSDNVNLVKIKNHLPELAIQVAEGEKKVEEKIANAVKEYLTLNILEKCWWRLTRPVDDYIMFHDILTLKAMKQTLNPDDMVAFNQIYKQSALNQLKGFWDELVGSWRQVLDTMIAAVPFLPPKTKNAGGESMPNHAPEQDALPKNPQNQLDTKVIIDEMKALVDNFISSASRIFLEINAKKIKPDKVEETLKELRKNCIGILLKIHPDKNSSAAKTAHTHTQRMTKILENIDSYLTNIQTHITVGEEQEWPSLSQQLDFYERIQAKQARELKEIAIEQRQMDQKIQILEVICQRMDEKIQNLEERLSKLESKFRATEEKFLQLSEDKKLEVVGEFFKKYPELLHNNESNEKEGEQPEAIFAYGSCNAPK